MGHMMHIYIYNSVLKYETFSENISLTVESWTGAMYIVFMHYYSQNGNTISFLLKKCILLLSRMMH